MAAFGTKASTNEDTTFSRSVTTDATTTTAGALVVTIDLAAGVTTITATEVLVAMFITGRFTVTTVAGHPKLTTTLTAAEQPLSTTKHH